MKNNLINKILEKSSNFNKEDLLNKNIIKNDINFYKSLNNKIQNNINTDKLNYYKKITKCKINEKRDVNIKNNNRNVIIISKRNPKAVSNLIKYNININNNRENYISGINTKNLLNNSTNLKKNRSNMNNIVLLKGNKYKNINNHINNFRSLL